MIRILTDTASDISLDYALKEDISLVSMKVNINNKEYIDKVNLSNDEFYQLLESSKDFPKTSQPAPLDFIKCFKEAKRNNDDLICILVLIEYIVIYLVILQPYLCKIINLQYLKA